MWAWDKKFLVAKTILYKQYIYSWLWRLNTARGSGTGLVTVGPAKVKACNIKK